MSPVAASSLRPPLRAAVIGAGQMGANHARAYALLGESSLVGVYDPDAARAHEVALAHGTQAARDLEALLHQADVVTIASPSHLHVEHALLALHHGCDVLIEKPVAPTAALARVLQHAVARDPRGPIVAAGHIEHFNPAVGELLKLVADRQLIGLDCRRLGPASTRNRDIDVVQDLMLHDLSLAIELAGGAPLSVHGSGYPVDGRLEYAVATIVFQSGAVATFGASRVTEERVRTMSITATDVHVTVDLAARRLETCRSTNLHPAAGAAVRQESIVERIHVPSQEPLLLQAKAFLQCCLERRPPVVGLDTAVRCLELVDRVRESAGVGAAQFPQTVPLAS